MKKQLTESNAGILMAAGAVLFGGILRLFPVYIAGFPINDGGLFYNMTRAIQENYFRLPEYVHYNGLNIPFAYPPFGFYVAAAIQEWLDVALIEVFRWLPAIVLIGSIFAFYFLARQILASPIKAGFATLIFALTPRSITWGIMGGGVTRSFGQLFFILTVLFAFRLFNKRSRKLLLPLIFSSTLLVFSHPEAALHAIAICLLIFLLFGRDRQSLFYALITSGGVFVLTAIWWLPVIQHFGMEPFLSAGRTGWQDTFRSLYFLTSFSNEPAITFVMVLAFIGISSEIVQKKYFLPIFFVLPFVAEPRNAANISLLALSLLASQGFCDVIIPGLDLLKNSTEKSLSSYHNNFYTLIIFVGIYLFIGMLYFDTNLATKRVTQPNQEAFEWIKTNTPENSRFIFITGNLDVFSDWTQEWFPALTDRVSVTTVQGWEWIDGKNFLKRVHTSQDFQHCISEDSPLTCIETKTREQNLEYNYIFIVKRTAESNIQTQGENLISELKNNNNYNLNYRTEDVVIFYLEND